MKLFLAIAALAVIALCFYKIHTDKIATDRLRSVPVQVKAIGLSRVIEPLYARLFAKLDPGDPLDVAPPIEITRERILDKRAHVDADKQRVFDLGLNLLGEMLPVAEERTKTLQALVQAAASNSPLDSPGSTINSRAFLAQGVLKRWEEDQKRRKPRFDQFLSQLREAEREWNKRAGERAPLETYDLPVLKPLRVTAEPSIEVFNPLERSTYNSRRIRYPWRRTYYDQYGYPGAVR